MLLHSEKLDDLSGFSDFISTKIYKNKTEVIDKLQSLIVMIDGFEPKPDVKPHPITKDDIEFSAKQVAEMLETNKSNVVYWCNNGILKAHKRNKRGDFGIYLNDLLAFITVDSRFRHLIPSVKEKFKYKF